MKGEKFKKTSTQQGLKQFKIISHQNTLAAIKLQSNIRGFIKRVQLWRFGGILMFNNVRKIQLCYRCYFSRKKLNQLRQAFLAIKANCLIGFFRILIAKNKCNFLRKKRLEFYAIKIQRFVRGTFARLITRLVRKMLLRYNVFSEDFMLK
jgi:hypothetical protein